MTRENRPLFILLNGPNSRQRITLLHGHKSIGAGKSNNKGKFHYGPGLGCRRFLGKENSISFVRNFIGKWGNFIE